MSNRLRKSCVGSVLAALIAGPGLAGPVMAFGLEFVGA